MACTRHETMTTNDIHTGQNNQVKEIPNCDL